MKKRHKLTYCIYGDKMFRLCYLNERIVDVRRPFSYAFKELFVIFSPLLYRKFCDSVSLFIYFHHRAIDSIASFLRTFLNGSSESFVPWNHWHHFLYIQQMSNIGNNFPWIIVGNVRTPTCSNFFTTIDKNQRYNGYVPMWK